MKYVKRKLYIKRIKSKRIMSDNKSNTDKVFVKGNVKKVTFNNGGSILNASFNVEHINKIHAWMNDQRVKRGLDPSDYIPLTIKEKRETDEHGNTHYAIYEPWFPESKNVASTPAPAKTAAPAGESTDDLPF